MKKYQDRMSLDQIKALKALSECRSATAGSVVFRSLQCSRLYIFQAAYQSLILLARDPKYLGSDRLGMTGVLHTWGRDLNYHPPVHFIVPGGAISLSGDQWLSSCIDFLVPVLALSKIYRAKFKELMKFYGLP